MPGQAEMAKQHVTNKATSLIVSACSFGHRSPQTYTYTTSLWQVLQKDTKGAHGLSPLSLRRTCDRLFIRLV